MLHVSDLAVSTVRFSLGLIVLGIPVTQDPIKWHVMTP